MIIICCIRGINAIE